MTHPPSNALKSDRIRIRFIISSFVNGSPFDSKQPDELDDVNEPVAADRDSVGELDMRSGLLFTPGPSILAACRRSPGLAGTEKIMRCAEHQDEPGPAREALTVRLGKML